MIVKSKHAKLTTKIGGKDNKVVRELKKGEIADIINIAQRNIGSFEIKQADGATGWVKKDFITRIGPSTQKQLDELTLMEKMAGEHGKTYEFFASLKTWGEKSTANTNILFFLKVLFVLLPFIITTILINLLCPIKPVPTWLIKLLLLIALFNSFRFLFSIYLTAPIYKSFVLAFAFQAFYTMWIFREWRKIEYFRCPKCHSWKQTAGSKIFLGGWKWEQQITYSDGRSKIEKGQTNSFREDRLCLVCNHGWSFYKIVGSGPTKHV